MADGVELVRGEAAEVVFGDLAVAEQGGEDMRQDGVAVVADRAFELPAESQVEGSAGGLLRRGLS